MCCAIQQHSNCKKRAIFNRIKALLSHFKAFFAISNDKTKTIFSFKKRVKIKLSTMDKSQRKHFIA